MPNIIAQKTEYINFAIAGEVGFYNGNSRPVWWGASKDSMETDGI